MSRCVDDVNSMIPPGTRRGRGSNCNAAFFFLFHPIHGGTTLVDLPNLVGFTSVEKDAFGGSSFPSVNVGHDTNVAIHV